MLRQEEGTFLVFSRTKHGADRVARKLEKLGHDADAIHGDRSQSQRTAALTSFQQGRVRVLVATDVAARGIHVDEISQVINYDLPEMAENFIHRVGRSGRAGAQGLATTLFGMDQRGELVAIERTLGIKIERMQASDLPERAGRKTPVHRTQSDAASRIGRMPGEFLQAQTV
jgi:ATP-dependent RNA helicase RhlE